MSEIHTLCLLFWLNACNLECIGGGFKCCFEILELVREESRIIIQSKSQSSDGLLGAFWLIGKVWILIEISQAFLVFIQSQAQIISLECRISKPLQIRCDLDDLLSGGCGIVVFWEVLVWIASLVCGLGIC